MITRHLIIASNNDHKHQELREIFATLKLNAVLHTPRELGIDLDPAETSGTYVGNVLIKARAFAQARNAKPNLAHMWVIADDSGLEVDVLGGRPGVESAPYHKQAPNGDGCAALLNEMYQVSEAQRSARFRAIIALIDPQNHEMLFEGLCEGKIAREKRGKGGFGFDPVFLIAGDFRGRTLSELSQAEKNEVSHRGVAVRAMRVAFD
jgi:XTP/dITP diphosphohydrolase